MISQAHRFHGRNSLRFVYQRGQNSRGGAVSLRYIENTRRHKYRVAVVVSRKVSKSAVVRNRIRRRVYELVREHARRCTKPLDLVFTVYGDTVAELPQAELERVIVSQLQKAGACDPVAPDHAIVGSKEN